MAKEGEVVCVTGGSSCIGSWLVHEPLDRGYTVQATVQDQRNVGFSTMRPDIKSPVQIVTGGAPPPASLLEQIKPLGFHVTHAYGLTEATGPALVCDWQAKWNQLPRDEQAKLKARQGISILTLADVDVKEQRRISVSSRSSSSTTPPFSALSLAVPESSTWRLLASSIKSMIT
ncbi:trans-cinnamate:CoA ligase, peroxisomal, partial [Fagus crenata]